MDPTSGCDRVTFEAIAAAAAAGDVDLVSLYARNLLHALKEIWPIAEAANDAAYKLHEASRRMRDL